MVKLSETGVFIVDNQIIAAPDAAPNLNKQEAYKKTMTYQILSKHNLDDDFENLSLQFDSITSHDITYVGIIQTARASGMKKFPIPYVLTNCHNSLCAVGGSINEDDHKFALSAAKKYGGIFVPANLAVIHTYNREMMTAVGRMILGSDSHTRYGALGTMGVGEGGGELAKQLVGQSYDIPYPEVIAIYLEGEPQNGIGPLDVALNIIKAVYASGYVKNKVMEFVGPGVAALPVEFRNGIDVMATETTCWSSIWETDEQVHEYYKTHHRAADYRELKPENGAYYDGLVYVDLSKIEASIALPFHPSNVYTIRELKENPIEILKSVEDNAKEIFAGQDLNFDLVSKVRDGEIYVDQGVVAGCAGGTYDNIMAVADTLEGKSTGQDVFSLSIYPGSQPIQLFLMRNGALSSLVEAGAIVRSAFCGPCFGAGDTPANGELSIRHTTRNFPNREGSKPGEGQISYVALMDAKSIAATAANGGKLTAATDLNINYKNQPFKFYESVYQNRVLDNTEIADDSEPLVFGPNIKDWPEMPELKEHLLVNLASYILDPVTTTDELIPSGESSSYRSNPERLAQLTLSRKDPEYVNRTKNIKAMYEILDENDVLLKKIQKIVGAETTIADISMGSAIYAHRPGDGSAREQAASCQKVLGAFANFAKEYATKRYRTNLINWGMVPFLTEEYEKISLNDHIFVPHIKETLQSGEHKLIGYILNDELTPINLDLGKLSKSERQILVDGCLINHYRNLNEKQPAL